MQRCPIKKILVSLCWRAVSKLFFKLKRQRKDMKNINARQQLQDK
jgi:hypothetical protein